MSQIQLDSREDLRLWLAKHSSTIAYPLWIIIYKKASGKQTLSYEEVVEEAICFGLIDTQSKSVDEQRYSICLRPRRPGGHWTAGNLKIAQQMIEQGKMTPAGLKALPPPQ
jgi:uncharacterized protein YdeI (YjbR/CyaY-like superfamily)